MSTHLEHRKILERELRNAGIKQYQIERNGSGHMEIRVDHGGKKVLVCRTSWTPSDYNSTPNARAQMRRKLRDVGLLNNSERPVGKFARALAMPTPGQQSYEDRITELELTVSFLLDAVATLADRAGVDLEPRAVPTAAPVPVAAEPKKKRGGNVPMTGSSASKVHALLLAMEYSWLHVREIKKRTGRTQVATSVALTNAKKRGEVESGARGFWRKVRRKVPDATEAPPLPAPKPVHVPAPKAPQIALLDAMEYGWLPRGVIEQRSGLTGKILSAALSYQKRVGNVENGMRGMWRKRRLHSNGAANGAVHSAVP